MKKWTIEDSKELYNICGWGTSYFGINDKGDVYVTPCKDNTQIDLRDIMDELALRDINAPVLLRFPDILDNRIEKTASCFQKAKEEYGYKGENFVIYPIKVNQMQPVVEEIISHGKKFNLGLEAGSKPELHAVIAVQAQSDSLIICNGYKDESYIELALLAQKMGKRIFIVVEKLNELDIIEKVAKKLNVKPNIGIRIKLASSGSGKWAESGGDASKFGLTSAELLTALKKIDEMGFHDCLRLIHFHIGSQITKIRRIQTALREAAQFYISLHKMGYNVDFVDCGGGLGVDYDGTRSSSSESSVNYSIQEYVNDCVYTFVDAANKSNIEHPNLITEAMRGYGGILRLPNGESFMEKYDKRLSLAPRDIVARAIDKEMKIHGLDHVCLDVTHKNPEETKRHFPNIYAKCLSIGIDITKEYIPVRPAAHYMCGGIKVDLNGCSSINRLYALGECSCTGLHGGNRLASNSLIEAVVYAETAAKHSIEHVDEYDFNEKVPAWNDEGTLTNEEKVLITQSVKEVGECMSNYVGIVRSDLRLKRAWDRLDLLYEETENLFKRVKVSKELCELRNMINVGYLITRMAIERKESRGLHYTIDYPVHAYDKE